MELQNNKSQTEKRQALRRQILNLRSSDFERLALDIFRYQALYNPVYGQYIQHLNIKPEQVTRLTDIPFLPVQFFKHHIIRSCEPPATAVIFESSGTTGQQTSQHHLFDETLYKTVSNRIFQENFGDLNQFHILALLPSYLERNNSSLVYMMQHFIAESKSEISGFYLKNVDEMLKTLMFLANNPDGRKVLMLGVTFALLDLAESEYDLSFLSQIRDLTVMDTGGMKGRRQELLREEVHDILTAKLFVDKIYSEYGMTEMLSQGYSHGGGLLVPGFSMRILLRDINDPFAIYDHNINSSKTGGINVIDLANLDSCSFIETQDLGRFGEKEGSFYVMGRFDNSDIRGCNLMVI
ncbi:acyl transferase [Dyadobacter chenwenxiniae]|uniref:Acyl transferase n=1 Tax=Dyadobacter chenwenxiniae TaxID=2906456 RepID=A0A9X1TDA4_9BACT|nr:acyl transferase [Dyadobacter chenwenxiniae]MCF0060085.1 acyl transferase [Dyadobacter chenwenxiniae]UON85825.1 acyl transferase [Dyadobacter chenwenxiniae]